MSRPHRPLPRIALVLGLALAPVVFPAAAEDTPRGWFQRGQALVEAWQFREAWPWIERAARAEPGNGNYRYLRMNLAAWMGMQALAAGDHAGARTFFAAALALKTATSTNRDQEYVALRRFADITEEHAGYRAVRPEYVHKVQVLYLLKTDLTDTTNLQGAPVVCRGQVTTNQIRFLALEQELLRVYVETLTKGRLSLSFDRRAVDTTVRRAWIYIPVAVNTKYRPDYESCEPSIGPLLFAGRNAYDTRLFYWYRHPLHVMPFAFGPRPAWVPYALRAPVDRGQINMPLGEEGRGSTALARFAYHWVLFHEFFHLVEAASRGISPSHAHTDIPAARRACPAWVPDLNPAWTATEYSWYRHHFHHTVPEKMEEQARVTGLWPPYRNFSWLLRQPDRTDERACRAYAAALDQVPPARLRRAADLADAGARKLRADRSAALALFVESLKYNPYQRRALAELAADALGKKDFAAADRLYGTLDSAYPDPGERFRHAQAFLAHREPARAARRFRALADETGRNPVYALWAARSLAATGDLAGMETALARLRGNAVYAAPLATVTTPGGGAALVDGGNPEEATAPALGRVSREAAALWRLVPAGAGGQVRIVGEHGWRALAARGTPAHPVLALEPFDPADAGQVWRITRAADGARLVCATGASLVHGTGAAGKGTLSLRASGAPDDAAAAWDIRVVEAAFSGPRPSWPAALLAAISGGALDLYGGKRGDGAPVGLWEHVPSSPNQRWRLAPAGPAGQVHVVSGLTGKHLAVAEKNGRRVTVQAAPSTDAAQRWTLVALPGGQALVNVRYGHALVPPPSRRGALTLAPYDGSAAQGWRIVY